MSTINFNTMTLDEVEQIELLAGRSIDSIMADETPRGRAFKAIIFVMTKRTNPNITFEEAGKYTLEQAAAIFGGDDDPKALNENKPND